MEEIKMLKLARDAIGYTYMGGSIEDLTLPQEVIDFIIPDGGLLDLYDRVIELLESTLTPVDGDGRVEP